MISHSEEQAVDRILTRGTLSESCDIICGRSLTIFVGSHSEKFTRGALFQYRSSSSGVLLIL